MGKLNNHGNVMMAFDWVYTAPLNAQPPGKDFTETALVIVDFAGDVYLVQTTAVVKPQ